MRGKQSPKRKITPDEIYNSEVVAKLINSVMLDGKKSLARRLVYKTMEDLGTQTKSEPLVALEKALGNVKPKLEVRARRVGGANYQVPMPVPEGRQLNLAFRWIIAAARKGRGSKEFWQSLSKELSAAYNNEGDAVRKKDDVQRMAESNRAFAQFAM